MNDIIKAMRAAAESAQEVCAANLNQAGQEKTKDQFDLFCLAAGFCKSIEHILNIAADRLEAESKEPGTEEPGGNG